MPLRSDWSEELCPVRRSLDVIGDPWVLLIVLEALHGRARFDQMRVGLGISDAVLSRRLRTMVEAGLLERVEDPEGPRGRHGYVATPAAAELLPILQQLALWAERHTQLPPGGAHMPMVHRSCGARTTSGEVCSGCGETLLPQEMTWVKPWKGTHEDLVAPGVLGPVTLPGQDPPSAMMRG